MNSSNGEDDRVGGDEAGTSSSGPIDPATLSEMLSVLRNRTNRRILCHLLNDDALSVERLTTRLAEERSVFVHDGVESGGKRNDMDTRS